MNRHINNGLHGTKTEQNLRTAAQNEAMGFTKYMLYSGLASDEANEDMARMFSEYASNEKEHAELWLGYLDELGGVEDNLNNAIYGEEFEATEFYPNAARIAAEEGFDELADKFRMAANIEKRHADSYRTAADDLASGRMYTGNADTQWVCLNCGYTTRGNMPPSQCPFCSYPKGYFKKANCFE